MKSSKLFLTSLLAAAAMSAAPAWAEDYTVTGAVKQGSDNTTLAPNTGGSITNSSGSVSTAAVTSSDNFTFNGVTGYLPGWDNATFKGNIILAADSESASAFIWDEGSSQYNKTITFSGSLSGSGTFEKNTGNKKQSFIFAGDVTGFSGNFLLATRDANVSTSALTFGNGGAAVTGTYENGNAKSVSGTGQISWAGQSVVFNYNNTNAATVGNSSITTKTLTFSGGANYTVSSTVTGSDSTASNNTLTISAGTTTFTGAVSNFGTINVASGAKAIFQGAFTNVVGSTKNNLTIAAGSDVSFQSTVAGGVLTANADSTVKFSSTASFTQLSGSGTIDLGSTGTLTLSPPSGSSKFNNWMGTIKVGERSDVRGNDNNNGVNSAYWNCGGATVEFSGAKGWLEGFNGGTFAANIKLVDTASGAAGFQWKDGSSTSNLIATLSGKLTGTGTFERENNGFNQSFVFSGNLSVFAGTFKHTNSKNYATLTFGGKTNAIEGISAADGSVTGTSTINWYQGTLDSGQDKRVYFNYSNDVRSDSTITGAILVKQGAGSLKLTGTNTYTGGTTVEAGTLIAGSARAFGSGALTVNAGAKVSANGYAVDLGAGNVTINGTYVVTADGSLATSGAITFGAAGTLDVSGLAAGTYTIFGGTGTVSGLTQDKLYKEFGRDTVTFADDTYKTFTLTKGAVYNLTWTSAAETWSTDTTWQNNTLGGEENPTFADGDTVTFAASETAAKEISVVGAKDAQAVNVTGGDYALSAGEGGSLSVRGALTVSSDASLTVNEGVLGAVSGGISLEADSTLKLVGAAIHGMTNVVSGEGKVVLDKGSVISTEPTISTANVLRGAISVEKIGNTKVSITAAQSYTGGTKITAGIIGVGHNSALGSGRITLNGGQITAHIAALTLANAIEIGAHGGTIHTNDNASNKVTLTGEISGTGTLKKAGSGTLFIKGSNTNAFHGTLVVESGVVMMGQDDNGRSDSSLTDSAHGAKIFVKSGATFTTHMGSADAASPNTFNGDFYIASGATLGNKDGHVKLAGNIVFGATDTEGNFDSNATVTYAQYWRKAVEFAGAISGAGMVTLQNATAENGTAYYKISGSDNTFAGTYKLTGAANRLVKFQLTDETAAQNATINLSTQYASMELGAGAVRIAGLEGVSGSSVTLLSGTAASTLTVNQTANTTFAGTLAAGIALLKDGAGTLTLSGDNSANSSGVEIAKGVVEATNAAALGAAANAVRISGGQLKVSNVTLNQTAITVVLGEAYKTSAALVGENGGALATGTTVTVGATDLGALGLVAEVANEYSIWNESLETSGATLKLSDAFRTLLADAGWTSSISGGTLTISAIPEPSVFGLLAGLGALALAGTRRRRKKA